MAASEIETAEKPYDERRWWQILETVYLRPLTPYELKREYERMLKRDCGEDLTSERWDLMIEHIRDWYSADDYEPTPEEVVADAEQQEKTFLYWDAMNLLEQSLKRSPTFEESKQLRQKALNRPLTEKELQLEESSFDEWSEYRSEVEADVAKWGVGFDALYTVLFTGKDDGSAFPTEEIDRILKKYMNFEMWEALISTLDDEASESASARTVKGHSKRYPAMDFVKAEWAKHRLAYQGNKSEFARVYSRRVLNEHGVKVTDKQIREVWLKNPPVASKPDGMQATG